MTIPLILEVAISMVFLYLLGSQVVLSIYELWAGYTNSRGKFLYRKLKGTLGTKTTQAVYAQAPIAALTPAGQVPPETRPENAHGTSPLSTALDLTVDNSSRIKWWLGMDGLPAYIPANLFASTLLAMIKPSATKAVDVTTALNDAAQSEVVADNAKALANTARTAVINASAKAHDARANAITARTEAANLKTKAVGARAESSEIRKKAVGTRNDAITARAEVATTGTEEAAHIATTAEAEANIAENAALAAELTASTAENAAATAEAKAISVENAALTAELNVSNAENAAAIAEAKAIADEKNVPTWFSTKGNELLAKLLEGLDAGATLEECQKSVAAWYDDYNERLTGWYKRQVRLWLFLIGLVVAFVANIDSPFIISYLWAHPQLSSSIADAATREIKSEKSELSTLKIQKGAPPCDSVKNAQSSRIDTLEAKLRVSKKLIQALNDHLHGLGFPIGRADSAGRDSARLPAMFYVLHPARTVRQGRKLVEIPDYYLQYTRTAKTGETAIVPGVESQSFEWTKKAIPAKNVSKKDLEGDADRSEEKPWYEPVFGPQSQSAWNTFWGWLLTAAALSVGAPFWFDLLCRLVNIRNLGIKPPRPAQ